MIIAYQLLKGGCKLQITLITMMFSPVLHCELNGDR